MKQAQLSLETARKMYEQGGASKAFALENYTEAELNPPTYPTTWEECMKQIGVGNTYYTHGLGKAVKEEYTQKISNCYINYPTRELAEASIALAQLSIAREVYRGGWVPDWGNEKQKKYCIYFFENKIDAWGSTRTHIFLSFPTAEIRNVFLTNFRDLIEKAKPLMS
jgi:hypothetical protein